MLSNTRSRRAASAFKRMGMSGSTQVIIEISFSCASLANISAVLSTILSNSKSLLSGSMWPKSARQKSSQSLKWDCKTRPEILISWASALCCGDKWLSSNNSALLLSILFSDFFNSWLTDERKSALRSGEAYKLRRVVGVIDIAYNLLSWHYRRFYNGVANICIFFLIALVSNLIINWHHFTNILLTANQYLIWRINE